MEKKQLNLSAPLLSARRYSSPLRSSGEDNRRDSVTENRYLIRSQQSDMNLGEVVKPGSVPFMWEQAPGKAKDGIESRLTSPDEPCTPNHPQPMPFPPGRRSGELNAVRTPNKLSGELIVLRQRNKLSGELNVVTPQNRFSRELNSSYRYSNLNNDSMIRWDSSKEGIEMNASSESELDDDGTFSDAVQTFSQQGSFSVNCSISGLSGSEPPGTNSSGSVSSDPKEMDFMMNRFLPAAKAMTLDPSLYASRKQMVAVEQPKEVKALVLRPNTPLPAYPACQIVPYTGQDIGSDESGDGESSFDERSNISIKVKACRFLPWFCSKNSLRLMNPLPAMKIRSKNALSSASKVGNLIKTKSWRSPSQQQLKQDSFNPHGHRVAPLFKSCELQKPVYANRAMFYSGELQTRTGSPYRSSRRSNASPYTNDSPHSSYQNGGGLLASPKPAYPFDHKKYSAAQKGLKRFEDPRKNRSSGLRTAVAEKTLYIDSVNIPKVSHSILNVSRTKRQTDATSRSGPLFDGLKSGASLQHGGGIEILKARGVSGPLFPQNVIPNPSKLSENRNTNSCRDLVPVNDDLAMQSSLAPPLPKSPSESWLSRQIPSVSPRNSASYSSLHSNLVSRKQNSKSPICGAKWETIVKSSHLCKDHGRYSEELVTHVPQPPRIWK